MKKIRFFLDFDGTISKKDVVDLILERFGLSQWTEIEKLWLEGKIGSRECLSRQIDLVSANEVEFTALLNEVEVDPDFVSFISQAKNIGIPVTIVSDGFNIVIEHILRKTFQDSPELLSTLPVYSNKLQRTHRGFKTVFPEGPLCEHACANCKERVIKTLTSADERIIFVGDGLSDRFAAQVSDLTFAKGKLLKFCQEKNIEHLPYSSFNDVEKWLLKERKVSHALV